MIRQSVIVAAFFLALLAAGPVMAVQFTGAQTGEGEWSYDLTYDPQDNYSICQQFTTITLSGMSGVTGAFAPVSTDYLPPAGFLDLTNLAWTPEVLDGGATVRWTHDGSGTGNFSTAKHVFGFRVLAQNAVNGTINATTDGFETDVSCVERDISVSVAGPVSVEAPVVAPSTPIPTLGLTSLIVLTLMLGGLGVYILRRQTP